MGKLCKIILIIVSTLFQCLLELCYSFFSFICTLGHYPYNMFYLLFIYLFSFVFFISFILHIILVIRFFKGKTKHYIEQKMPTYIFYIEMTLLLILIINDLIVFIKHNNDIDYGILAIVYFSYQILFNYIFFGCHYLFSRTLIKNLDDNSIPTGYGSVKDTVSEMAELKSDKVNKTKDSQFEEKGKKQEEQNNKKID